MRIRTRRARAGDRAAVWALYEAALRGHIEAIWGWDDGWQADHFDHAWQVAITCIVERDGVACGYVQLDAGEREVYLRMLVLAPAARSHGIGAALLAAIVSRARASGREPRLRVFRVNDHARRFYLREGWQVTGQDAAFYEMAPPPRPGGSFAGTPKVIHAADFDIAFDARDPD